MPGMAQRQAGRASLIGASLGPYRAIALIGRGAMGTVYLARDTALQRNVALKVLLGTLAGNPTIVRSFHREAQATAPLNHPHIVRMYSAGVEHGTPYIAMEYVEGEPLDRFIRRTGRLPWANALYIASQVADALDHAHQHGVIHRDVKPANILLDRHGRARLTDFGIANVQADSQDLVGKGGFIGTPKYMSPEQCSGREVGPGGDLFSLGVTTYQMIAGRLPFELDAPEALIESIMSDEAPRLDKVAPGVPDDVARLIAHMMEKDPDARPESGAAVVERIQHLQSEQGGRSAIPEALAAFIREQAQIPSVSVSTPTPWKHRLQQKGSTGPEGPWLSTRRSFMVAAGVVAFCLVAVLVTLAAGHVRRGALPPPAPDFTALHVSEPVHGQVALELMTPGFDVADLRWLGDDPILVTRLAGREGSLLLGAQGLLAFDVTTRRCRSLEAPQVPALDRMYRRGEPSLAALPAVPRTSPLYQAVVVRGRATDGRGRAVPDEARAQRWDEGAPRAAVLYRSEDRQPSAPAPWTGAFASSVKAAAHPNGYTLCLLMEDPSGGTTLVERDIRTSPRDLTGPVRTRPGAPIVPESVQYSPDGTWIGYLRVTSGGTRELYVMASGDESLDGTLLAMGDLGDTFAVSPNQYLVAVSQRKRGANRRELLLLSQSDGGEIARLGPGTLGPEAWHPSGTYLVATAPDPDMAGRDQLWAVEAQAPYRRVRLTDSRGGVHAGAAVSRDGHWACVAEGGRTNPRIVFVDLDLVRFGRVRVARGTAP
jgi:serine/threonine protein kinase